MKDDKLREAYDSLTPGFWDVERMRKRLAEALPDEESNTRKGYHAFPEKTGWWSTVSAAAVCLAVLLLGAFVIGKMEPYRPDQVSPTKQASQLETEPTAIPPQTQETTEPEPEPEDQEETLPQTPSTPFTPGDYQDYVNWYRQRNQEDNRATTEFYAYYDLNSDGIRDLLIGADKDSVKEAVTCIDGQLKLLFNVGCNFTVCTDGSIYTGQEGDTHFVWYRLYGDEQYVTMTVWYDEQAGLWYMYNSQIDKKTVMTESDVEALLASCEPVDLEMNKLVNFVAK